MPSNWVKDYFTFTKRERIAIIVLVSLILSVYFLPAFFSTQPPGFNERDRARLDSLAKFFDETDSDFVPHQTSHYSDDNKSYEKNSPELQLFFFDPNTASANEWARLGLKGKTIQIIQHYIQRGGKFHKADDLKKIYGLRQEDFERLKPYLKIETGIIARFPKVDSSSRNTRDSLFHHERKDFFDVELNIVDSAALCRLPGIGSTLASRIIHFRDRLGGFYSIDQLAETYGLSDTTFNKIRPFLHLGTTPLATININEADVERLRKHPYITWSMAKALVNYREQHGPFKAVEDLWKISVFGTDESKRLFPYLSTY